MEDILTWEQASDVIHMLRFDLGESAKSIKEGFEEGYILKYNTVINRYCWYNK